MKTSVTFLFLLSSFLPSFPVKKIVLLKTLAGKSPILLTMYRLLLYLTW